MKLPYNFRSVIVIAAILALGAGPVAAQLRSEQPAAQSAARDDLQTKRPGGVDGSVSVIQGAAQSTFEPDELVAPSQNANNAPRDAATKRNVRLQQPNEFEKFSSDIAGKELRRFGSELLVSQLPNYITPVTAIVPPSYRLNPGDEIVLGLTGSIQASNLRLVVDTEGHIFIPRVGVVRVGGVPFGDLQTTIAQQVARQYRDFRVSATIGQLRGITVNVTGFAEVPGSYTLSSLSTLVNAALAAGGPSAGGSFRSIQLRRSGKLIADLDLYAFLIRGDTSGDLVLQDNDVITIAPSGAQVAVVGSVNREGIYEVRANDTINDALLYAGGANTVADLSRLHLLDPAGTTGWVELDPSALTTTRADRGKILRVLSSVGIAQPSQRLQSLVTISGEVMKPGRYFVAPGTSLQQVLEMAGGLTPEAYAFGSVFVRDSLRRGHEKKVEQFVNEVRIALTADPLVRADGSQTEFALRQNSVDVLARYIRERRNEGRLVLETAGDTNRIKSSFVLENNDELYIPPRPLSVGVFGLVKSTAYFQFKPGNRIRDYIDEAGGFAKLADRKNALVIRADGTVLGGRSSLGQVAMPGDVIFVPVDSNRGSFWKHFSEIFSFGMQAGLTAASIVAVTK